MVIGNSLKKRFLKSRQNLIYCVNNFLDYNTFFINRNFIMDSRESLFNSMELYLPKGKFFKVGDIVVILDRNMS